MKANYHTHTWRCNHATGTEEEYVQAAITRGLETLGFSDHTPYYFPGDYYSTFRMRMEQLDDYTDCISRLADTYCDQIDIKIGVEAEYYPALFPKLLDRLRDSEVSYLILGLHMIGNEVNGEYTGHPTGDLAVLKQYVYQVLDAMQTGLFTYLAHPDLIHYIGDRTNYRKYMRQLCQEAKQLSIPLEYNLLGLATNRHYPNSEFWEIAAEIGNCVVLGCDAHEPEALRTTDAEEEARKRLAELGITPVEVPVLLSIR